MLQKMSIDRLTVQNELENRLRVLLFYINFPLTAITAVFFRQVFFHGRESFEPALSYVVTPSTTDQFEALRYTLMSLVVFLPIILVGISHIVFSKRETHRLSITEIDHLESEKYLVMTFTIDMCILFVGLLLAYLVLSPFYGQPYLYIVFLLVYGIFFLGKIYVLMTLETDLQTRKERI